LIHHAKAGCGMRDETKLDTPRAEGHFNRSNIRK
jgi:hypothetical protein